MNRTSFYHARNYSHHLGLLPKGGETYYVELPNLKDLIKKIGTDINAPIFLLFGSAKCHESDLYNKKEGAKIAKERAKIVEFKFTSLVMGGNVIRLNVSNDEYVIEFHQKIDREGSVLNGVFKIEEW